MIEWSLLGDMKHNPCEFDVITNCYQLADVQSADNGEGSKGRLSEGHHDLAA